MMARKQGRTQACTAADARARREHARKFHVKDAAQYGFIHLSGAELRGVLRHASHLLAFAEQVRER